MARSIKKGPYVDAKLLKKIEGKKPIETGVIKTWSRACVIAPEMVGFTFGVHNGKSQIEVLVSEDMVGHRLGEFSPTKKFIKHGGKMQKELEQKKKEGEIAAAQSAKAVTEPAAGAAKNLGPIMRTARTVLPSVALDATFGGIQGAGQAEPGKRLEGAAHDAMFNAGFNVAGTAALGAVPAYKAAKKAMREAKMNPEAKLAEQVAGKPFDYTAGMTAPSDAARQEWIGKAHDVGANAFKTNDPAYKAAVFNAHREAGHPLITEHGAQNYDQMMKMAYENLGKETATQARAIPNKMEFWGDADYAAKDYLARAKEMGMKPAELMRQELAQGKPMQVYKDTLTEKNPGHPYLADVDPATGVNANEKFRAVHDYFGHLGTKTPNQFGPKGEENAWMAHRQMYSPLAEPAMTAETRGQNSYVNYVDPENVALRAQKKPTTNFAKNLPVLLPPEASNPEYLGGLPSYLQGIVK
jgi:small subunit ribosomal protein S19